jgi:1-acyl-sn-glycerol-3-phosphate acyltransferase
MEVFNEAQKRINRGLRFVYFRRRCPDDESILLDTLKMALLEVIEHQIHSPITFADNKKRLSYTFFSGSPGLMRTNSFRN